MWKTQYKMHQTQHSTSSSGETDPQWDAVTSVERKAELLKDSEMQEKTASMEAGLDGYDE